MFGLAMFGLVVHILELILNHACVLILDVATGRTHINRHLKCAEAEVFFPLPSMYVKPTNAWQRLVWIMWVFLWIVGGFGMFQYLLQVYHEVYIKSHWWHHVTCDVLWGLLKTIGRCLDANWAKGVQGLSRSLWLAFIQLYDYMFQYHQHIVINNFVVVRVIGHYIVTM